jgi:hypothetical protein
MTDAFPVSDRYPEARTTLDPLTTQHEKTVNLTDAGHRAHDHSDDVQGCADPECFRGDIGLFLSVAKSFIGRSHLHADGGVAVIQPNGHLKGLMAAIDAKVTMTSGASALSSFRVSWRNGCGQPVDETERDELAEAAASNRVTMVGRSLGPRDVNQIVCTNLPAAVVGRSNSCVLLDASVGAGAGEVAGYLVIFTGQVLREIR